MRTRSIRSAGLDKVSNSLIVVGLVLCGIWLLARAHGELGSRAALLAFAANRPAEGSPSGIDFSLWSEKRIAAYKESLLRKIDPPLAVLRIPKIRVEVPVLEGTGEFALNRGVGRVIGTARPGLPGNIGIAGHRDGFFRGLKDITIGDLLILVAPDATATYTVDQMEIVSPQDVSAFSNRAAPSLTLVTCYPFYFAGDAPERFIVQASLSETTNNSGSRTSVDSRDDNSQGGKKK